MVWDCFVPKRVRQLRQVTIITDGKTYMHLAPQLVSEALVIGSEDVYQHGSKANVRQRQVKSVSRYWVSSMKKLFCIVLST